MGKKKRKTILALTQLRNRMRISRVVHTIYIYMMMVIYIAVVASRHSTISQRINLAWLLAPSYSPRRRGLVAVHYQSNEYLIDMKLARDSPTHASQRYLQLSATLTIEFAELCRDVS